MRPLDRQTILITGSTDGLGLETARALLGRGATVVVHGRAPQRIERALATLGHGGRAHGMVADLASLADVHRLARDVAALDRLHVLVNNAGIAPGDGPRRESRDGYELAFAVNYLSHYLLTLELLPLLRGSQPSRIICVASIGQAPIDFDDVMLERSYDGYRAYAQSKLAQILFTFELAERLRAASEDEVTANALHPATLMDTKMVRQSFGTGRTSVSEGVRALVRLVVDPKLDGKSGLYFDGLSETAAHPQAYDEEARRRLWALSEKMTGAGGGAIG
jgi:NAD(P)-dependent dehydrogenase (short-subunit alcohol dehydrogenase family)